MLSLRCNCHATCRRERSNSRFNLLMVRKPERAFNRVEPLRHLCVVTLTPSVFSQHNKTVFRTTALFLLAALAIVGQEFEVASIKLSDQNAQSQAVSAGIHIDGAQ